MQQGGAGLCLGRDLDRTVLAALPLGIQAPNALQVFERDAATTEDKGARCRLRVGVAVMRERLGVAGGDVFVITATGREVGYGDLSRAPLTACDRESLVGHVITEIATGQMAANRGRQLLATA